jgi:hypothetical protein
MKNFYAILGFIFILSGCGSVAPRYSTDANTWVNFNHKTKYSFIKKNENEIYLTVIYSSYTFYDSSIEALPLTRGLFKQVALDLADKNKNQFTLDESKFYESTGYNGLTGVSETLVSNSIYFVK